MQTATCKTRCTDQASLRTQAQHDEVLLADVRVSMHPEARHSREVEVVTRVDGDPSRDVTTPIA